MDKQGMIDLVTDYFTAVDGEDFAAIEGTLTEECVFCVETHGVELRGVSEIRGMFDRLWAAHQNVRHKDFEFVPDPGNDLIAVRFKVENTLLDGRKVHKSNCNFFDLRGDRFSRVAVYMAGENTLTAGAI